MVLAAGESFAALSELGPRCACVKKEDPYSEEQTSEYTEVVWVPKVAVINSGCYMAIRALR